MRMLHEIILITWLCGLTVIGVDMDNASVTQRVRAGGTVELRCTVQNLGDNTVMWFGPGGDLLFLGEKSVTTDRRFQLYRPYQSSWYVVIKNAKLDDSGVYRCKVRTEVVVTKEITLEVESAPRILPSKSSEDQRVKEGVEVTLTCGATGFPPPKIVWHLLADYEGPPLQLGFEPQLTISKIGREMAGLYRCKAFNGVAPNATRNIEVNVEYPPTIIVDIPDISQEKGQSAKLECIVSSHPQGHHYWMKDEKSLVKNWNYDPQNSRHNSTTTSMELYIKQAEPPSVFGVYYCVSENEYGRSVGNITLYEISKSTAKSTSGADNSGVIRLTPTGNSLFIVTVTVFLVF